MNTPTAHPQTHRRAAGHTLVELVLSMTLLAIVMASAGSAMLFAAKASPRLDGPTATLIKDSGALNRVAEDLAQAKYVLSRSSTSVKILVDDRTGDGTPDHISYEWSGTPGDPLTYAINKSTPVAIIEAVDTFGLDFELTPVTTTIPPAIYYGSEKLIQSFENTSGGPVDVDATDAHGQVITPILDASAVGMIPTRAEFYGERQVPANGTLNVELRGVETLEPNDTTYAQAALSEFALPLTAGWHAFAFEDAGFVERGDQVSLVFTYGGGDNEAARLYYDASFGGRITSTDAGAIWSNVLFSSLAYKLYGMEVFQVNEGFDIKRDHVTAVTITLQSVADDRSPLRRNVRLLRAPELLDIFWETSFDVSPVAEDLNDDNVSDWIYGGGGAIPDSDLNAGVWDAKRSLIPIPRTQIDNVVRVDVRLCTKNNEDASIHGPYVLNSDGDNLPIVCVLSKVDGEAQKLIVYNDTLQTRVLTTVTDLGEDWVDVHLTVLPDEDTLYLKVNGVSKGSFALQREADTGERGVWLTGTDSGSAFTHARFSIGGSYTDLSDGSALLSDVLGGLLD